MTSGAVASVAMPMGEVHKRSRDEVVEDGGPEKSPKVDSPRNWGDWKNPSLAGVKKAKKVSESTGVTDYNPPSKGGTRKELLAKYHKTKNPKDAEAARKAGATQKELKGVAEGSVNDYFKRRKDEEDRIAGTKAPAKRTPKQTDYEKKRKDQGVAEGQEFGTYYYEELAQKVFDQNPGLEGEAAILKAGYDIAKKELGSRANGVFRDDDFPGDLVSSYRWLCKNAGENLAENRVDSPVSQAIIRRILNQRTGLLAKFGPEAVMQAVDEVAEWHDDVEEIGSSDVSAWVSQVERMLRTGAGEGIREQYSVTEAGSRGNYDMHTEIMNPAYLEWENGGGDEDNPPPETIQVGVNYSIYGEYRPATWGYSGGSPEEHPEIDEMRVYNLETGEELTDLDSDTLDAIEEKIWDNNEGGGDGGDDYYDDSRDEYYESKTTEGKTGPGLWANIHAKRERIKSGSGERMREPGSKGAPTSQSIKAARKGS